ncbi:nuclear transport factor 2 family protein [Aquimarina sp. AU119]|uniref:nuclear transport factor 2 family protein n=1 Tax=Aquimarina sp. AU119 TaxID=2108528 RepID=UPI000D68CEED|nr:nuclear transport factor 2 family protein [Aquimarina sp. AU119]
MKKVLQNNLLLIISVLSLTVLHFPKSSAQQNVQEKYFRHLRYNHVSPHVELRGIHEINFQEAQQTSHYVFRYNKVNQLKEIINYHYHDQRRHPLSTIGAYRTVFRYTDTSEVRIFFDKKGDRMMNDRQVYKEQYTFDKKKFKYKLNFYDLDDNPMESNWKIARYQWSKNRKMVIEKRYNLKNRHVNISPYFDFGITGILYQKDGAPKGNYNLNEQLEIQENDVGVASYQDVYDDIGNHIQYSYHDKNDKLVKNQWGFAIGKNDYDNIGNNTKRSTFDENNNLIDTRDLPSNRIIEVASAASKKDTLEIKEKALGYLIALQELKPDLMKSVFHEDLAKRTLGYDPKEKQQIIRETSYKQMVKFAESWNQSGVKFPPKPNNKVIILDIYNHVASVKLISDNWVEYLHLIYINDNWQIINLLWQHKDVRRYKMKE